MKNLSLTSIVRSALIACALAIGVTASTTSVVAQSNRGTIAIVNVPFAFQIGSQQMPSGLYRINFGLGNMLLLYGPGQVVTTVMTHPEIASKVPTKGFVAFHHIGDAYFLEGLWRVGDDYGMECSQSRAEKEMLRASTKQAPSLTKLALNSAPRR
jgi:hypothetical protein